MWVTSLLETYLQPTQVALGNFDGVHRGHCAVIRALFTAAEQPPLKVPQIAADFSLIADQGLQDSGDRTTQSPPPCYPTVVSFNPHPQVFFSGQPKPLLTVLPEKIQVLELLGVKQLVLLPFDRALATLTPIAFVEQILVQQLKAQKISVGFDFCFGRDRSGTALDLQVIAAQYGIPVVIVAPETIDGQRISSSEIRQALTVGNVALAERLLGRPYALTGTVEPGQQLGRTLGFPTANLSIAAEKFIPALGVYSVYIEGPAFATPHISVMNIGNRPTVDGSHITLEVHVLDWFGDLYGHTVTVHLQQFLRPEQKFESLDALKTQIALDCEAARALG